MSLGNSQIVRVAILLATAIVASLGVTRPVGASCGSASCFLAIGNMPSVQPKNLVRVDLNYSYVPQTGPNNQVAAVNIERQQQVLNEHLEFQTINQQVRLDVNYGLTDNWTLQFQVPIVSREHDHRIEVGEGTAPAIGEFENFDATGLGDISFLAKYGFLPNLRSLLVFDLGAVAPTGNFEARNISGGIQEPTLQIGRGNWGILVHAFQQYELIPHKLNQFFSYTWNHTFENKHNYQFGDTNLFAFGLNWLATPRTTLSLQLNYTYIIQDQFVGSLKAHGTIQNPGEFELSDQIIQRGVENTGRTTLLLTPGITLRLGENTSWYFYGQAPLVQDANGGLEQDPSLLTGFVHFFTVGGDNS